MANQVQVRKCTGKNGDNLHLVVPVGTIAYEATTDQKMGEVLRHGDVLKLAQGGMHGIGNIHFKSSVNQAPRRFTYGEEGEFFQVRLELKLLADVGLLGLPNAGKSTFIRYISAAKPKVADYPFTTMYPHLGVVHVEKYKNFIVADIPGIIEGAAEGAGLGLKFLKHLSRTKYIFHILDVLPVDGSNPVDNYFKVENELKKYSMLLYNKPRWLILNKIDQLCCEKVNQVCSEILQNTKWNKKDPYFLISGITGYNIELILQKISSALI